MNRAPRCCAPTARPPAPGSTTQTATRNLAGAVALAACWSLLTAPVSAEPSVLDNGNIRWRGEQTAEAIHPLSLENPADGSSIALGTECFQLVLADGTRIKSSQFELAAKPSLEAVAPEGDASALARRIPGRQISARFLCREPELQAKWCVILRGDGSYLREELTLRAGAHDVGLNEIILFEQALPGAQTVGSVEGSPVVVGRFFMGYEHPMAGNTVDAQGTVCCRFVRRAVLKAGESLTQSCVLGLTPPGETRRGFLAYLERERARPYRPFLHYNSWFDIAWDRRKFSEAECLDAIRSFGRELVQKRGVQLQSFLLDDGWDDNRTLWKFHDGFPRGFSGVRSAAESLGAGIGVWISPFGGYDLARERRLEYGVQQGFETNAAGFSLSGPKYYQRFREIALDMVRRYGVNMFKFDGLAAGNQASQTGQTRDGDAMLRLILELRAAAPDLYINQTVGTWPSPFWLRYVDSTWRGGADHDFAGQGSTRQRWITYRDAQTYQNVVQRAPLYPLNSLMLHGIICARHASQLERADPGDFRDEARSFFASGTQLQELYVTPGSLQPVNWDALAEAAAWAHSNANVLADTHWIGGDPARGQVYGWAAWTPRKAALTLRNPADHQASFTVEARSAFELPAGIDAPIVLAQPWKNADSNSVSLFPGKPHAFKLRPFEVLVLESQTHPTAISSPTSSNHQRRAEATKNSDRPGKTRD